MKKASKRNAEGRKPFSGRTCAPSGQAGQVPPL